MRMLNENAREKEIPNEKLEELLAKELQKNEFSRKIIEIATNQGYLVTLEVIDIEGDTNAEFRVEEDKKEIKINVSRNIKNKTGNPTIDQKGNLSLRDILFYRAMHELGHVLNFFKEKNPEIEKNLNQIIQIAKSLRSSGRGGLSVVGSSPWYKEVSESLNLPSHDLPATEDAMEILATRFGFPEEFENYKKLLVTKKEGNQMASLSEEEIEPLSLSVENINNALFEKKENKPEETVQKTSKNVEKIIEENKTSEERKNNPEEEKKEVLNAKTDNVGEINRFEQESQKRTEKLKERVQKMKERLSFWGQKFEEKITETKEGVRYQIKEMKKEMKELQIPRKIRSSSWLVVKEFLFPPWNIFKIGNPLKWKKVLLRLREKWENYAKEEMRKAGLRNEQKFAGKELLK